MKPYLIFKCSLYIFHSPPGLFLISTQPFYVFSGFVFNTTIGKYTLTLANNHHGRVIYAPRDIIIKKMFLKGLHPYFGMSQASISKRIKENQVEKKLILDFSHHSCHLYLKLMVSC